MMKRLSGAFAALALVTAGVAFADEYGEKKQRTEQQPATGGAGEEMRPGAMMQQELTGQVVKVEKNTLYLEREGVIIPFRLERGTKFEGAMTRADLKEGDQVRASFRVENEVNNVLTAVSKAAKMEREMKREMKPELEKELEMEPTP